MVEVVEGFEGAAGPIAAGDVVPGAWAGRRPLERLSVGASSVESPAKSTIQSFLRFAEVSGQLAKFAQAGISPNLASISVASRMYLAWEGRQRKGLL